MKLSFVALFACAGFVCVNANAQTPITACGTTISADGGNTYVLTADITNNNFSSLNPCIEFDNQTAQDLLDCQGYTLTSTVARDLIKVQNYGNLMVKNCTFTYGTYYNIIPGPAVEVLSGSTFQTAQGLTTGQSNFWNYANLLCSGGQQVLLNYDLFNEGTIELSSCSSATYPSSVSNVDESWRAGWAGTYGKPGGCIEVDTSDYVTVNAFGTKQCPASWAIGIFQGDNYLTITNGDFDGTWDGHTSGQGPDDGIIICPATGAACSTSSTGTAASTGLDIEYTQVERVYDACLEFVGWVNYGSIFHFDCSIAGIAGVGAYWNVSMDNMTFNYVSLLNSSAARGPFTIEQDNTALHGHGEGLTNLAIYNTSFDRGNVSGISNLGYTYSTPFDNYSNITLGNNTFGYYVYFQPGAGSVTDNGGNVCTTAVPSYLITCH